MPDKNCVNEHRVKRMNVYFGIVAITFIVMIVFLNS
jgi:hypothetical protein